VALAQERNFHKAARVSHITQPTLSSALRQLEAELGVPLVRRSNQRFEGFMEDGERVLDVARRMVADAQVLKQSLNAPQGQLAGHLRIGIIPTAEPLAGQITAAFHARQPNVTITLLSKTSQDIERGVAEHMLEAGISYVERGAAGARLLAYPLYSEDYVVIGSDELLGLTRTRISWQEAAKLPLVLLNREMQNRRLIDEAFARAGAVPRVMAESSTLVGIFSHVRQGAWCGIVPSTFAALLGPVGGLRVLALADHLTQHTVGILTLSRKPLPPSGTGADRCAAGPLGDRRKGQAARLIGFLDHGAVITHLPRAAGCWQAALKDHERSARNGRSNHLQPARAALADRRQVGGRNYVQDLLHRQPGHRGRRGPYCRGRP
jgi:DNA-binding transcriptional LysR family regulator